MSKESFNEEWTCDIVWKIHRYRMGRGEIAERCGYTVSYLSTVLNGKKEFKSGEAKLKTRRHIEAVIAEMEEEILRRYSDDYDHIS